MAQEIGLLQQMARLSFALTKPSCPMYLEVPNVVSVWVCEPQQTPRSESEGILLSG